MLRTVAQERGFLFNFYIFSTTCFVLTQLAHTCIGLTVILMKGQRSEDPCAALNEVI